ncbi:MAG: hypothetical protein RL398_2950, partial [Planctomycetota bacterium]
QAFLAWTLLTGTALCQVAIPPHSSVYNGYTRGFNFTAQNAFQIVQLELPLDAFQAGDSAGFAVRVNGTMAFHLVGQVGPAVPCNIAVQPGDIVDVVGNWSPAAPGTFTAHNSYGNAAPYATVIEGVPHTLNRTGVQDDIANPAWVPGNGFLAPTTGAIGRVLMYTAPAAGFASKSLYGSGCYDRPRMVYENFPFNSAIDLVNTSQSLIFAGTNYIVIPAGPAYDGVTPAATGTNLALQTYTSSSSANWDDASIVMTLPATTFPAGFPYPAAGGGSVTQITINSNGKIYLGATFDTSFETNGANYASLAPFQGTTGAALPVLAPFNCDLDPTVGGAIWYEDPSPSGGVRITWAGVPNWAGGAAPPVNCDMQVELLPSGQVNFAYGPSLGNGGAAANDAIVGFSAGFGEPLSAPVDWSSLNGYVTGDGSIALALDADNRPVLGTTINMTATNIPAGTVIVAVFYGLLKFDPGIPLGGIGMPDCFQFCSTDATLTGILPGTTYSRPFAVPSNPAFAGVSILSQSAALAPGVVANALGAITSNGVELTLNAN